MGYNKKITYCDLAELKSLTTVSATFKTCSLEGQQREASGSIVDLTLGSFSDFGKGWASSCRDHTTAVMDPVSWAAGSSKRARAPNSGGQIVTCLVDGCRADLGKCRDYHRRHKVCEMHSKTPRVTIGGHEQRFCQQCSRFHALGEFDEGKRSCRKRLEGHNRRRRKPQPEPLPVNPGNFLSASQGSRFLPYSNQPLISASSVVTATWSGAAKTESNPAMYNGRVSSSNTQAYRGRQFPFLQMRDSPLTGASSTGQTLNHDGSSISSSNDPHKMLCNGLNQVIDSDRALSLLSSSPTETPEMGLGRIIHSSPTNVARPILSGLHYNTLMPYPEFQVQGLDGQLGGSAILSNMRNSSSLCQDVFQSGSDGSSASAGHQALSFSWE